MEGHGFRAMARTILDEVLGFRPDIIEHQLKTPSPRKATQLYLSVFDHRRIRSLDTPMNSSFSIDSDYCQLRLMVAMAWRIIFVKLFLVLKD